MLPNPLGIPPMDEESTLPRISPVWPTAIVALWCVRTHTRCDRGCHTRGTMSIVLAFIVGQPAVMVKAMTGNSGDRTFHNSFLLTCLVRSTLRCLNVSPLLYVSLFRFLLVSFIAHIVDPHLVPFRLVPRLLHLLSLDSHSCIKARRTPLLYSRRSTPVAYLPYLFLILPLACLTPRSAPPPTLPVTV